MNHFEEKVLFWNRRFDTEVSISFIGIKINCINISKLCSHSSFLHENRFVAKEHRCQLNRNTDKRMNLALIGWYLSKALEVYKIKTKIYVTINSKEFHHQMNFIRFIWYHFWSSKRNICYTIKILISVSLATYDIE